LLPLEEAILRLGCARAGRAGDEWFYGFAVASELRSSDDGQGLLGHGTLYKALDRLEVQGLLESRWEDVDPVTAGRPRRREYRVTSAAAGALDDSLRLTRPSPDVGWLAT
jgi:DNA-binding PadR family transcriptional regulator